MLRRCAAERVRAEQDGPDRRRADPLRSGRRGSGPLRAWAALAVVLLWSVAGQAQVPAATSGPPPAAGPAGTIAIAYLGFTEPAHVALSALEIPPAEDGLQGARLALRDNQTTGRFLKQSYVLDETVAHDAAGVLAAFHALAASGHTLFVTDLPAPILLQLVDLPEAKADTFLDATSTADSLRAEGCRANVLHLLPSDAMRADALMQYLTVKQWRNLLLVVGKTEADRAYADALRRSARKFRMKLVDDKPWTFDPGARRTDTGHFAIANEVARFTQGLSYDVLLVADTTGEFGDELSYRTTEPRPVMGTAGLVPTAWQFPFEEWGATQLQLRFQKVAHRWMTERDFGAWMAVRAIGEAATRSASTDAAALAGFLHGKDFQLAAFKGVSLTFRPWDGQLRQPVLLMDTQSLVSVSPQPGFLHPDSELDTLGIDQPETKCHKP